MSRQHFLLLSILVGTSVFSLLYAIRERSEATAQEYARNQLAATLSGSRAEIRTLTSRLDAMTTAAARTPAPPPPVHSPTASAPVVRRRVSAQPVGRPRNADDPRWKRVESQLADCMDQPKLIGDIVTHWHKYGERRKTVAFAVNVAHSVHLKEEFVKSGVRAEHIDGSTPKPERDASLARLASGEIELITNCMVLSEGWDMPEVGCCILARPTKKMGLYRQMIGRVLRPAPGKTVLRGQRRAFPAHLRGVRSVRSKHPDLSL